MIPLPDVPRTPYEERGRSLTRSRESRSVEVPNLDLSIRGGALIGRAEEHRPITIDSVVSTRELKDLRMWEVPGLRSDVPRELLGEEV
jgi:hypothetical protein